MEIVNRKGCRAILLTPQNEVLLAKISDPAGGWVGWITPGGGMEEGETEEEALRRELWEELEFRSAGGEKRVWFRAHEFPWNQKIIRQEEVFFLIHTEKFASKSLEDLSAEEKTYVKEVRWWPLHELKVSTEEFAPRQLGHYLELLLKEIPKSPINVGI